MGVVRAKACVNGGSPGDEVSVGHSVEQLKGGVKITTGGVEGEKCGLDEDVGAKVELDGDGVELGSRGEGGGVGAGFEEAREGEVSLSSR